MEFQRPTAELEWRLASVGKVVLAGVADEPGAVELAVVATAARHFDLIDSTPSAPSHLTRLWDTAAVGVGCTGDDRAALGRVVAGPQGLTGKARCSVAHSAEVALGSVPSKRRVTN